MKTQKPTVKIGDVLTFKHAYQIERYGSTATVTKIERVQSRPFGYTVTLIDMTTANGTKIQWASAQVRSAFKR